MGRLLCNMRHGNANADIYSDSKCRFRRRVVRVRLWPICTLPNVTGKYVVPEPACMRGACKLFGFMEQLGILLTVL